MGGKVQREREKDNPKQVPRPVEPGGGLDLTALRSQLGPESRVWMLNQPSHPGGPKGCFS